jgi:hypothetical protein
VLEVFGYSGTAKPTNVEDYRVSLIVKNVVEILDAEKIQKVVGHDGYVHTNKKLGWQECLP